MVVNGVAPLSTVPTKVVLGLNVENEPKSLVLLGNLRDFVEETVAEVPSGGQVLCGPTDRRNRSVDQEIVGVPVPFHSTNFRSRPRIPRLRAATGRARRSETARPD